MKLNHSEIIQRQFYITLSEDEAQRLRAILGCFAKKRDVDPLRDLFNALDEAFVSNGRAYDVLVPSAPYLVECK